MRARLVACLLLLDACSMPTSTAEVAEPVSAAPVSTLPSAIATGSAKVEVPTLEPFGDLDIDPASFDFKGNPNLVGRIADSPHAYFRFTQRLFARAVCKRFDAKVNTAPKVRLHGDPHVEQYAVSDLGRGLADFDDAAVGPPFLDLTRFATSAVLASRLQKLPAEDESKVLGEMFRGYRAGLKGATLPKEPPRFITELVSKFKKDKKDFLQFVQGSLISLDGKEDDFVRTEVKAYMGALKGAAKRPESFFSVKKLGRTKLGIGSALTRKYLVILEGSSPSADDDVVMELKEIADLSAVPCMKGIPSGAVDARVDEQKKAGDKKLLAPALLSDGKFWVNEWLSNYQEAKIKKLSAADLQALAYEAGVALSTEHRKPLPDAAAPSPDSLAVSDGLEQEIQTAAREMADQTSKSWTRFKREVQGQ